MSIENNLNKNPDEVNQKFEYDDNLKRIREQVVNKFIEYRKTIDYLAADAPIATLCLPTVIENALLAHGCLRIYDLFDCDFTEVKGLGVRRIGDLTSSLDKFFSML